MPRFLIEVPHEADQLACARVVKLFLASGSHLLTNADWGCMDGDHRSWLIVDVANKQEALAIVPPMLRSAAHIIGLNQFSMSQVDAILGKHSAAQ